MSADSIIGLVLIITLLFLSAMISGSEIAFFSLDHNNIAEIKKNPGKSGNLVIKLIEKPKWLLSTILIANNVINIAIIILSSFVMRSLFDFSNNPALGFFIQVIMVTFLLLLFAEVLPKLYAKQHALKFASIMVVPLLALKTLFYPLSSLLIYSTNLIDKRIARKRPNISMNELSHALDITTSHESEENKRILKGIVQFGNIYAREIMKSRMDVVAVDLTTNFKDLIKIILEAGYSRIPVYKDTFDNIEGILYIKDLLPHIEEGDNFEWQKLIRSSFYVPESKKINDLLKEFQEKKIHLAIVVDEYGGTSGIITLEDIMEEIVGEINDEFDVEEAVYSKIDDNTYVFEGKTLLKDFAKITDSNYSIFDSVKGEADTIAGLLLEIKQDLPFKGEIISYECFEFEVESVDKKRIKRVKITITKK
jgi:putative hemolysin